MKIKKVLIAEDNEGLLWVTEKFLREKGIDVETARDGIAAKKLISEHEFHLALLDINMPGMSGLELLKDIKTSTPRTDVIIMTAEATIENAIEAMKKGAFDYITKPFDIDELEVVTARALENIKLKESVSALKERLGERTAEETTFVGMSKAVQSVFKTIGKTAEKDVTVLISGESGTGKELIARLIHANSHRGIGPFVAVNSAAIPRELMESELLGFEKGAFTGAVESKKGKFELAEGGTLFLDEIGDMPLELQAKLLRAIQEKEFYRIGAKASVKVDVRIIAATNHDLEKAIKEKKFREDLYYRLNVVTINLPALRERTGDIELLSKHFLEKFHSEMCVEKKTLSPEALEDMERYHWPGNIRELENTLLRAVLTSSNVALSPRDLMLPGTKKKKESLEEMISLRLEDYIEKTSIKGRHELYDTILPFMERPLIKLVLKKVDSNQVKAAELLGINRNTLRKKINDLGIDLSKLKHAP
ncbi:MAG: sigma-54-dependent Fis family transcriptional regulator [Deltaproteobacteria bacterium]|nr:sigma-54-dependent Fis family transcriptional regulator [Deltaproteobacteria bacterium]